MKASFDNQVISFSTGWFSVCLIKLSTGIKAYLKISEDTAAITLKKATQYNANTYCVIFVN